MSNCEEVIISVTKGATEIEAKYKWHGRRYVTSNGMVGKLVRCKDCKWYNGQYCFNEKSCFPKAPKADDFCSYGEKETDHE